MAVCWAVAGIANSSEAVMTGAESSFPVNDASARRAMEFGITAFFPLRVGRGMVVDTKPEWLRPGPNNRSVIAKAQQSGKEFFLLDLLHF
ncbi:MAG: hypothetical protein AB7R90_06255 [Reyranellaceae bacterium]